MSENDYHYIEFMAVSNDGHAQPYARGNFLKGMTHPHKGRQVIRQQ